MLVDDLIRALCDDRGLACWESGVDGHGKDVPVPAHLGGKLVDRTKSRYGKLSEEDIIVDAASLRGVADHDPNAPAGVYMRHFQSLP